MEQSLRAAIGGHSVPRRNLLLGAAGTVGLAAAVSLGGGALTSVAPAMVRTATDFDWDTGNVLEEVLLPATAQPLEESIHGNDATIVIRLVMLLQTAWYEAIAPYHPTAVGVYFRPPRRPASEGATNRNKNIALLYASLRVLNSFLPDRTADWRGVLTSVGLDPDDNSTDLSTPTGIGNVAGTTMCNARYHDGMNELGDGNGRKYNRMPYADTTGYAPVNTAYELKNPARWQPKVKSPRRGIFTVQQFVTPQMKDTKPFTYTDVTQYRVKPPANSDPKKNWSGYKQQADEVLQASANLTEVQKCTIDVYDNKFIGLGISVGAAAKNFNLDLDGWVQLHFVTAIAAFDACIAVTYNKWYYDAVRPFSAIRYIYGDNPVTAWGGPGKGTVTDLPASQWESFLSLADHPEYPSISTSLCTAHAQAARRYLNSDALNFSFTWPKGSNTIEPGLVPSQDLTLTWATWTDLVRDCGLSRWWGGAHFISAVQTAWDFAGVFGDQAYDFCMAHINGTV